MYQAHISQEADPLNLVRTEVPSELASLVAKMMAKNPDRRFQTPGEVAEALAPFYKNANSTVMGQKTDISGMGTLPVKRPETGAISKPIQQATVAEGSTVLAKEEFEPTVAEPGSKSGIGFQKRERSKEGEPAVAGPIHRRSRRVVVAVVGTAFLGLVIALGVILRINTSDGGTLVIDVSEPGAVVTVDEKPVTVTWDASRKKAEIKVKPGEHEVEITKDGFTAKGTKVTISEGGRTIASVVLEPAPLVARGPEVTVHSPASLPKGPPHEKADRPEKLDNSSDRKAYAFDSNPDDWKTQGDELLQTRMPSPSFPLLLFGDARWTDYEFSFKAMIEEGGATYDSFGLVFRSRGPESRYTYLQAMTSDNCSLVASVFGKKDIALTKEGPNGVKPNVWYAYRIRVRGDHMEGFISNGADEAALFDVEDKLHRNGQVGLMTMRARCRFKDIKVTALDGKVLWEGLPEGLPNIPSSVAANTSAKEPQSVETGAADSPAATSKTPSEVVVKSDPGGPELIKNPSCEEKGDGKGIPSWTSVVGDWTNAAQTVPPFEGNAYFSPGGVKYAELLQDVDVSPYAKQIDKKEQAFRFVARVRSWRQPNPDLSQVVIGFLDRSRTKTLDVFAFPPVASVDGWRRLDAALNVPAQTRFIRISLRSHRQAGGANDGVFDGLSLRAIEPAGVAPAKQASESLNEPGKKPMPSFVLDGTWSVEGDELVQSDKDVFARMLLGDRPIANFNMKYKVKFIDGPEGPWLNSVFHYSPPLHQGPIGDQYNFEIKGRHKGEMVTYRLNEWKRDGAITEIPVLLGQWYEVEFQVRGPNYRVLFDGQERYHQIAQFRSGWVGLGSAYCVTHYKDISIFTQDGKVLWQGLPSMVDLKGAETSIQRTDLPAATPAPVVKDDPPPPAAVARVKAAPDSPEGPLNAKGLWRSGIYFVVAGETEVLEKFKTIRPLIASMAQAFELFALALNKEALLAEAENVYSESKAQVDNANAVLSKMPNGTRANNIEKLDYQAAVAFRDGLVQGRDNAAAQVEAIRGQQVSAEQKQALVDDFMAKRAEYLKAAAELRPLYDKVKAEYDQLLADPAVKKAVKNDVAEYHRTTKSDAALGPSGNLGKAIDMIRHAERAYSPETAAPKKKRQTTKR